MDLSRKKLLVINAIHVHGYQNFQGSQFYVSRKYYLANRVREEEEEEEEKEVHEYL